MGKAAYEIAIKRRMQDMKFAIDGVQRKLQNEVDVRRKVDLVVRLTELQRQSQEMRQKLQSLQTEPGGAWANVKAEFRQEWNGLMEDIESRVGSLS